MDFSQWLADVDGRQVGNGQCWDLAEDFSTRVAGGGLLSTQVGSHPGYAGNVWEGYGSNGVEQWFTQAPASATAGPGWLAVWAFGMPYTPFSHIAVTVQDKGLGIECETQNPGVAHRETLPKVGLLGYLVPRGAGANAVTADFNPWVPWLNKDTANGLLNSGVGQALAPLIQLGAFMESVTKWFSDPGNWRRIGVFVLGAVLVVIALVKMFGADAMKVVNNVAG